jgi:hypothetical protein
MLPSNLQNDLDGRDDILSENRLSFEEVQAALKACKDYERSERELTLQSDPNIFFNQYGIPGLVYLDFVQKQTMGDPNLLGFFYYGGGSKSSVSMEGSVDDMVDVGLHEVYHSMFAHSETAHRYMESKGAFDDPRNTLKLRRQVDSRYN